MQQSHSSKANSYSASQEIPSPCMETETSSPCSQEPAHGPV